MGLFLLVFGHHGCQRSVLLPLSVCSAICSCHASQCSSAHKAWICMQASSAKHMPMWREAAPVPRCMAKHRFTTTAPESSAAAPTCSKFSWQLCAATALLTTTPDQLMSKAHLQFRHIVVLVPIHSSLLYCQQLMAASKSYMLPGIDSI